MLRIKEKKWKEFCENAEKFGFNPIADRNEYFKRSEFGEGTLIRDDKVLCTSAECGYVNVELANVIFDLITQGFVEKIEEENGN